MATIAEHVFTDAEWKDIKAEFKNIFRATKSSVIYKITNKINNKIYIGQFNGGLPNFWSYPGGGVLLKKAYKKYGRKNFKREILYCGKFNENLVDALEKHYIQLYASFLPNKGYNIEKGGKKDTRFKVTSGTNHLGYARQKPILKVSKNGEVIKKYERAGDVLEDHPTFRIRNLNACANGKDASYKGFIWVRKEEDITEAILRLQKPQKRSLIVWCYKGGVWKKFTSILSAQRFYNSFFNHVPKQFITRDYIWVCDVLVSKDKLNIIPDKIIDYTNRKDIKPIYANLKGSIQQFQHKKELCRTLNINYATLAYNLRKGDVAKLNDIVISANPQLLLT